MFPFYFSFCVYFCYVRMLSQRGADFPVVCQLMRKFIGDILSRFHASLPEWSKGPHSSCGVVRRVGSTPTGCKYFLPSVKPHLCTFRTVRSLLYFCALKLSNRANKSAFVYRSVYPPVTWRIFDPHRSRESGVRFPDAECSFAQTGDEYRIIEPIFPWMDN